MKHHFIFTTLVLLFLAPLCADDNQYTVTFEGVENHDTNKLIKEASQLVALKKTPPQTQAALKRRAEADIPNIVNALHTFAFYNAKVDVTIDFSLVPISVNYTIDPGPVYPLNSFTINSGDLCITPGDVGIVLNRPAYPNDILDAEDALLNFLARKGHPLATITDRQIIADQSTREIDVIIDIDPGPLATFGPVSIVGNCGVKERYIKKKISWCSGQQYDPCLIDQTINNLEATRLFNCVSVTYENEPQDDNRLPIIIDISEARSRSIGLGASYSTQRGAGGTAEWENRNLFGAGEKLHFEADVLQKLQECTLTFTKPDFGAPGQQLVSFTEYVHDDTESYNSSEFILGSYIERPLNSCTKFSYGLTYKHLRNTQTENVGNFNLAMIPLTLKWASVDDCLDPKYGASLYLKTSPTAQLLGEQFGYATTTMTASVYYPLDWTCNIVFAGKLSVGMIAGAARREIPSSELFYAGSENTLRGYEYYSVGAGVDSNGNPKGGRSIMIYTAEGRFKLSQNWGAVVFYDTGDVYPTPYPQFDAKWLHSTGIGVRYYTPAGPLRLDVAFPLNRRKAFDNSYQIYLSVGQAF